MGIVQEKNKSETRMLTVTFPRQRHAGIYNESLANHEITVGGSVIINLRFADEIDGLTFTESLFANHIKYLIPNSCIHRENMVWGD